MFILIDSHDLRVICYIGKSNNKYNTIAVQLSFLLVNYNINVLNKNKTKWILLMITKNLDEKLSDSYSR